MKELSGTKHRAVDLDPLKCNDDQQSKEPKKEDLWLLVYVTSVSVFWHSSWIDFVLEWKMRKRRHGEQGSLIRQHCTISNLITKYVTYRWLLFVVADFFQFLNPPFWMSGGAGAVSGSTKHTSLVFQPNLFSFSTDRYPQLLSSSQLSSPHQQAPLCCFIATRLSVPPSQTVFNISR